jgi:hypothetical protein
MIDRPSCLLACFSSIQNCSGERHPPYTFPCHFTLHVQLFCFPRPQHCRDCLYNNTTTMKRQWEG